MLSFASATGNLFDRLGKLGALIKNTRSFQVTQEAAMIGASGVTEEYNSEPDLEAMMGSSYINLLDNSTSSYGSIAQSIARATVNRMVFRDNPQIGQTLTRGDTFTSLREIVRQMKVQGATVLAQTITAAPTSFTGTGNGAVVVSTRRPVDGLVLEHTLAETIRVTCSLDSYSGNITEGRESFTATGTGAQSNLFAFNWPLGSDCVAGISAINGATNNTQGNILTNSGFDAWTGNDIDNWEIEEGTGGTDLIKDTGSAFDGGTALRLVGDGNTLIRLAQEFGDSSNGTSGTLNELTQYGFCIFMRRDGIAAAAGELTVELVDSGGTVIQDTAGNPNSFTIDLTVLTTEYAAQTGVFRTPYVLPNEYSIRLRLSTALTNGRAVYLDRASLGTMQQLYRGGPYLSVHSGATPFVVSDYATVVVTNSRGAGGTLDTWQTLFQRLFPEVMTAELLLPSSAVPTISDDLIG